MNKLLLSILLIISALSGCVSMGALPISGNDAVRESYNQISPLMDIQGSMDESKTGQTINVTIPLLSF